MPTDPALTPRERVLLHQIHPLKLATDWGTATAAAYLLWRHQLDTALVVGLVPPVIVTAALLRRADLGPLRASASGRYIQRHMTRRMEALRFGGLALAWLAAWYHRPVGIAIGVLVILAAWARGAVSPGEQDAGTSHR